MKLVLLIVFIQIQYIQTYRTVKRQGIFGLCQGWGAGCASYPMPKPIRRKPTPIVPPVSSIHVPKSKPDVSFRPHTFFFTSGESWNPIGKRTAWFTDIPYLRNPLLKYPSLNKARGNKLSWRYPLVYRNSFRKYFPLSVQE